MENAPQTPQIPAQPSFQMPQQPPVRKKFFTKKKTVIILVSIAVLIIGGIAALYIVRRIGFVNEVTRALEPIPKIMKDAAITGKNGFAVTLPKDVKSTDKVKIAGAGSFDGTTYCVSGTSLADGTVVYHVTEASEKPVAGDCSKGASDTKLTAAPVIVPAVADATQIGMTLTKMDAARSYTLQCSKDEGFDAKQTAQVTSPDLTNRCQDLEPSTLYFVRARANNASGASPWSSVVTQKTGDWSTAPTSLKFEAKTNTSVAYSWPATVDAVKYVLEWASDTSYTQDAGSLETKATSGTVTGLKENAQYYFHVKAITSEFDNTHAAYSETIPVSTNLAPLFIPVKEN